MRYSSLLLFGTILSLSATGSLIQASFITEDELKKEINQRLKVNTTALNLQNLYIKAKAIKVLSRDTSLKTTVTDLDLSHNFINKSGVLCLYNFLFENTTLTKLNLSHNIINDEALRVIRDSLEDNSCLKELNLANNYISNEKAKKFQKECFQKGITVDLSEQLPAHIPIKFSDVEKSKGKKGKSNQDLANAVTRYILGLQEEKQKAKEEKRLRKEAKRSQQTILSEQEIEDLCKQTVISLNNKKLSSKTVKLLAETIDEDSPVEILDLSSCCLSRKAAICLDLLLSESKAMKKLILNNNSFNDGDLEILSAGLEYSCQFNRTFTLVMYNNPFTQEGVEKFYKELGKYASQVRFKCEEEKIPETIKKLFPQEESKKKQ